jgi:hypothetical protein
MMKYRRRSRPSVTPHSQAMPTHSRCSAIRIYGSTAVITHVTEINERIGGAPAGGRFRTTRLLVKDGQGWRLVAVHGAPMQRQ